MSMQTPNTPAQHREDGNGAPNDLIALHARQFYDAAKLLVSDSRYTAPRMVIASFALELYLKSMNASYVFTEDVASGGEVVTAEPKKRGHRLLALYDELSLETKSDLDAKFAESTHHGDPTAIASVLRCDLEPFDDLFDDSRYAFERDKLESGLNLTRLTELLNFFHDYVEDRLSPNWRWPSAR